MNDLHIKRVFLYTLIGSVAFSALIGIWAILSGEFGEFQARVLGTTLIVVGTSLLGLMCGAFLESPKSQGSALKIVPFVGIVCAFVAAGVGLLAIWEIIKIEFVFFVKLGAVSLIFAFSMAQLSILSLANLSNKFQWALTTVYLVVLSLASISSILIVIEPESDGGIVLRLLGILAVLDAALTVMIPIFHRLSRGDFAQHQKNIQKIDEEISSLQSRIEQLQKQKASILSTTDN